MACLALEAIMKDQVEQFSLLLIEGQRGELGISENIVTIVVSAIKTI